MGTAAEQDRRTKRVSLALTEPEFADVALVADARGTDKGLLFRPALRGLRAEARRLRTVMWKRVAR